MYVKCARLRYEGASLRQSLRARHVVIISVQQPALFGVGVKYMLNKQTNSEIITAPASAVHQKRNACARACDKRNTPNVLR